MGNIAGSYVLDGEFKRDSLIRITREGEQIYEGKLASLKSGSQRHIGLVDRAHASVDALHHDLLVAEF